jgi:FO synthase subunit 2
MKKLSTPLIDEVCNLSNFRSSHDDEIKEIAQMLKKRGKELWIQTSVADELRYQQSGAEVTFVVNHNINFTQYCLGSCSFCSYSIKPKDSKSEASRMSLQEIKIETEKAVARDCSEICIQGGLDSELSFEFYIDILRTIKSVSPKIHIHGFSPSEIAFMSQISEETVEDVFKELIKNGLDSFPGTAAEILVDDVRRKICPEKISTDQWANVVLMGHSLGLKSTATILYGHIETYLEEAEHLAILKHLQEISGGFTEFIPLSFVYPNTKLYRYMGARPSSTGLHDLALFSAARLYFGELIPNIQASWVKLGPKLAQVSLNAGVNDLGGTLFAENITKSAGGKHGEEKSIEEFIDMIRDAGRIPVRRDTLYNKIQVF